MGFPMKILRESVGIQQKYGGLEQMKSEGKQQESGGLQQKYGSFQRKYLVSYENMGGIQ